jgi:ubiquinone/menaquinone biosynthesis C-methylase UbiE
MDITRIDPEAALFACRAEHRVRKGYLQQLVSWTPADAKRALDVGSGTGALALQLAERASFVIGVDTSLTMVDLARENQRESGKTNVAWVIACAEALPFSAAVFDYITSTFALRLSDLDHSLPELRRTISAGGRIAIRDMVAPAPRFGFWLDHCRRLMRLVPKFLRLYGWGGTWRILAYAMGGEGQRHARASRRLDAASFMEIFQKHFPEKECRFVFSPGKLFWENAPQRPGFPGEANHDVRRTAS